MKNAIAKLLLVFLPVVSSLSATNIETRKSTLRSWGGGTKLGWAEERNIGDGITEVSIGWYNDEVSERDKVVVTLYDHQERGSLSSSLWPPSIAGSILLRSPILRSALEGQNILELGSGLGLAGLVASITAPESRCILSERDSDAVEALKATATRNTQSGREIEVQRVEWRDDHTKTDILVDIVLGTDIAYYQYLLRPIMDVTRAHLIDHHGLVYIVGQANRDSQWELYHNIKDGCYNQLTDTDEGPWPGTTSMLLYELCVGPWMTKNAEDQSSTEESLSQEIIPIAALMHSDKKGYHHSLIGSNDHVATAADEKNQMKSF